jgi:hypothetical protein
MKDMSNIVYWYKNQVVITYHSQISVKASNNDVLNTISPYEQAINDRLRQDQTPYYLRQVGQNGMASQSTDAALASGDSTDLDGIYLFPTPTGRLINQSEALIAVFYTIEVDPQKSKTMQSSMDGTMSGKMDHTLPFIEHLHQHVKIRGIEFSAMPHWFWSGVQDGFHGCPTSPPIPVPDQVVPGYYKMSIQKLVDNSPLLEQTGKGVVVFVLDTLPSSEQLSDPIGKKNMLWQKMIVEGAQAIKTHYLDVPDQHKTAKTGKDIYGRLVGFPMVDHGLTIAGIVRDLAPDAQIECIQVLNEYGVGDTNTLYNALRSIENRMQKDGDLQGKPIVVNLSLVAVPPEADWARFHWKKLPGDKPPDQLKRMLKGLAGRMQSLALQGVVFVASVGNDSDPRDTMMNPEETRFGPRYPAAFASADQDLKVSTMIPVGAVNRDGKATLYSNHPGEGGLGATGGDLPRPDPWMPSAIAHINARVDPTQPIDAICGVYSSPYYPALSEHDHYPPLSPDSPEPPEYPEYQVSPRSTWAYWSGTSFAAPIITALAARVLQDHKATASSTSERIDVRQAIIQASAETTNWTGSVIEGKSAPVIRVTQTYE